MLTLAALALAAACSPGEGDGPYLEFLGGGFVFNYRLAEADYGFVVKRLRRIPEGPLIEARLEDQADGESFVILETASLEGLVYVLRSPPVRGVRAGRDYRVEVRLLEPGGRLLATYARTFRSDVDQEVLPERAPVVGPGHQPAPR